jgi:predicted glycosyltransferase
MTMRVMLYVQHLLGIGHIRRAALLCAAMKAQGLNVSVVLGGRDVPGIDFADATVVHLPMAHVIDHTFTPLLNENNLPVDDAWKENRKDQLLAFFQGFQPDVIVFEMYPFGRRQFRFELTPLLDAAKNARPKPVIVSSIRDILVNKPKPERNREIITLVRDAFDMVLVHGDETLIKLEESFPEARSINDLIRYTGYVAPPQKETSSDAGKDEVIVSAGGGAVGAGLLKTALQAKDLSRLADKTWRFITGPNISDADFLKLRDQAPEDVIIERFRPDLPLMLGNCLLSISQAGYNTIIDLLQGKAKAIVIPYDDGAESEQLQRARLLGDKNILKVVESRDLSPATLAKTINEAIDNGFHEVSAIDLSGAETSARMIAAFSGEGKRDG